MRRRDITAIFIAICSVITCISPAWSRGKVTLRTMLDASGTNYRETVTHHDGLGRPVQTIHKGVNTSGVPVVTISELNPDGSTARRWLPFAAQGVDGRIDRTVIPSLSAASLSDSCAWSDVTYDALGRETYASTPGEAWHEDSRGVETVHSTNTANSVRMYHADSKGITDKGYWPACTLKSEKTVDEDGHTVETFTDIAGHTVLERRGGDHDTYFVYNATGQLRFVLQPMYAEDPDKDLYAFEYGYDEYGNMTYKAVPGGGSTRYWYDRARRVTFMEDDHLRPKGLLRFFLYDKFGRQVIQGVTASTPPSTSLYTAEHTGGKTGFMQTGYTLPTSCGITGATLETVSYYDGYTFASSLDTRLSQASPVFAKGRCTGSVVYDSGGNRSMTAIYYDIRGNVTSTREIRGDGTLTVTENTYTFTDQPLTSKITESGGVTMLTSNVYDPGSGLLTATDVTVNGVSHRVAAVKYDDFGRTVSVTRGNSSQKGGTVSYTYNVHGQVRTIKSSDFSQTLHYADGPGTISYNGSVSSMTWETSLDDIVHGYRYTYNKYGWLISASYGVGKMILGGRDMYSERISSFNLNGGITGLVRRGKGLGSFYGNYGNVDDLRISYEGNRVTGVYENAHPVTHNGSMDFSGATGVTSVMEYDDSGALTRDDARDITSISYDNFGNPLRISYRNGNYSSFVYSATGEKLKATHVTSLAAQAIPGAVSVLQEPVYVDTRSDITGSAEYEYRGPLVYYNGSADMALFPGGFASLGDGVTFHHYIYDYLGNIRAVVNDSRHISEQIFAYYPYGGIIPDLSSYRIYHPYRFGGKELVTANGLNEYDFGARQYYQAVAMFTRPDPCAEKYYWLSPYLYCANDPVNKIDPTGEVWDTLWDIGNVVYDVGAAIYNHIVGDHEQAKSHWVDAAYDTGAALIPFVPAGASKLGKVARPIAGNAEKAVDAISDGKKVSNRLKNADAISEGRQFEDVQLRKAVERGDNVTPHVRLVPKNGKGNVKGNRTTTDQLIRNDDGTYTIVETKLSSTTPLSKGQKTAQDHVNYGTGVFEIRSDKPQYGLRKGEEIVVKEYRRVNKYEK